MTKETFLTTEYNCETGEVTERSMTQEEIDHLLLMREDARLREEQQQAEAAAVAAAKAAAEAKLAALGLTAEEIAALSK